MGSGMHENGSHKFSSRSKVICALILGDFGLRFKVVQSLSASTVEDSRDSKQ